MYVDVIREGRCWLFSILLIIKEAGLKFMEKRTTKYRMENIKYDFRLFLAGSLENASVEVLEIFYRRYMMAIDEDIYNTRYLPDFNWPHLENILNEFYRVKYFHESYFY